MVKAHSHGKLAKVVDQYQSLVSSTFSSEKEKSITSERDSSDDDVTTDNYGYNKSGAQLTVFSCVLIASISAFFEYDLFQATAEGWKATGKVNQKLWDQILNSFGDDTFTLYVYGTAFVVNSFYWLVGLAFAIKDLFNKVKNQPGMTEPVSIKKFLPALGLILFNQTFVTLSLLTVSFLIMEWTGSIASLQVLPSSTRVFFDFLVFILVEEVAFDYAQKLLQHRLLYKFVHKGHQEWTSPVALTAIYCHPVEHVLANLIPPILGPALVRSHLAVTWIWWAYMIVRKLREDRHNQQIGLSAEFHAEQRSKCNETGGFFDFFDYLQRTRSSGRRSFFDALLIQRQ